MEEKGRGVEEGAAVEAKSIGLAVPACRYGGRDGVQREAGGANDGTLQTVPMSLGAGLGPRPYSGAREALIHKGPENAIRDKGWAG